jgi:hypothetical protein
MKQRLWTPMFAETCLTGSGDPLSPKVKKPAPLCMVSTIVYPLTLSKGRNCRPKGRNYLPKGRNRCPKGRKRQPKDRKRHPKGRNRCPKGRKRQPKDRKRHPKGRNRQPKGRNRHPKGRERQIRGRDHGWPSGGSRVWDRFLGWWELSPGHKPIR